jgi:hypothetical protein
MPHIRRSKAASVTADLNEAARAADASRFSGMDHRE